jgi:hypothetical protein
VCEIIVQSSIEQRIGGNCEGIGCIAVRLPHIAYPGTKLEAGKRKERNPIAAPEKWRTSTSYFLMRGFASPSEG